MKRAAAISAGIAVAFIAICVVLSACRRPKAQGLLSYAATGITTANTVGTGPTGNCPLGFVQSDVNSSTCSAAFGWTPVYGDAGTVIGPTIPLSPGDDLFATLLVNMETPNAVDSTGHCWSRQKWGIAVLTDGGLMLSPTGADAGEAVDGECGSGMSGFSAGLVQSGNAVAISAYANGAMAAKGNLDYTRGALAPFVLSVSPTSITADAGGAITVTTTPGAAQFVTTATVAANVSSNGAVTGGFTVGCSQTASNVATCQVPPSAGYLSDGGLASGGIALTSAANPFPLASGFSFTAGGSGAITSVTGTRAHPSAWIGAVGGDPVSIAGTGFAAGGSLAASCNGVSLTSVTYVSPTQLTGTMPALTGVSSPTTSFSCTGTNGTGAALAGCTSCVTVHWDPSQESPYYWLRSDKVTFSGSSALTWPPSADSTGGFGTATPSGGAGNDPTYVASWTNGLPAISATGTGGANFVTGTAGSSISGPYTVLAIAQFTGTYTAGNVYYIENLIGTSVSIYDILYQASGSVPGLQSANGGTTIQTASGVSALSSPFAMEATFPTSGSGAIYINGASAATGTIAASAVNQLYIANYSGLSHPIQGDLGELIFRTGATSASAAEIAYRDAFWGLAF